MKLLFDQNLSPNLTEVLRDLFPGSLHVRDAGLDAATDAAVWAYAKEQAFVVVSKDADFRHLGFTYGPPPKIVWIQRGNCTTREIATLLRQRSGEMLEFCENESAAVLALSS